MNRFCCVAGLVCLGCAVYEWLSFAWQPVRFGFLSGAHFGEYTPYEFAPTAPGTEQRGFFAEFRHDAGIRTVAGEAIQELTPLGWQVQRDRDSVLLWNASEKLDVVIQPVPEGGSSVTIQSHEVASRVDEVRMRIGLAPLLEEVSFARVAHP